MLLDFTVSEVREFWKDNPLTVDGVELDEIDQYRFFWESGNYIPFEYALTIFNTLPVFLLKRGDSLSKFIERTIKTSLVDFLLPIREILKVIEPFVYNAPKPLDMRHFILCLFNRIYRVAVPGSTFRLVCHQESKCHNRGILLLSYDTKYEKKFYFDVASWKGIFLKLSPQIINLPSYEQVSTIADCRTINMVLDSTGVNEITTLDNNVYINGEKYGKEMDVTSFLTQQHISIKNCVIPSDKIVLIEQDFYSPQQKEPVLKKNTAYGTPFYLLEVVYERKEKSPRRFLTELLEKSIKHQLLLNKSVILHNNLLRACRNTFTLTYSKDHQVVSLNGKRLVGGTQAKIFRKIIRAYIYDKQKEFQYYEFVRDPNIYLDPYKPNMYIRIKRLTRKLQESCPSIKIIPQCQGKFSITHDGEIVFIDT